MAVCTGQPEMYLVLNGVLQCLVVGHQPLLVSKLEREEEGDNVYRLHSSHAVPCGPGGTEVCSVEYSSGLREGQEGRGGEGRVKHMQNRSSGLLPFCMALSASGYMPSMKQQQARLAHTSGWQLSSLVAISYSCTATHDSDIDSYSEQQGQQTLRARP